MTDPSATTPGAPFDPRARLPGYGPGALVLTDFGEVPVEWLAPGDRVLTRDHGPQPVLWLGHAKVTGAEMQRLPALVPRAVGEGAPGWGRPDHAVLFAPRTRLLLTGWEVALHCGETEALAEIADLGDDGAVRRPAIAETTLYTWILLAMHALVQVNGIWAETILLDAASRAALAGRLPEGLAELAEVAAGHDQASRLCLTRWEVMAMRSSPGHASALIDRAA